MKKGNGEGGELKATVKYGKLKGATGEKELEYEPKRVKRS